MFFLGFNFTAFQVVRIPSTAILRTPQLPVGLISSVGRALHRYRRGHGLESRLFRPEFFQALVSQLL